MVALFNIAGGVRYHLRGWRHADSLWQPFRHALGVWLTQWQPGGDKLVIIGPSGGYCLPAEWLGQFRKVVCLDPDPLARVIFTRKLRAASPATQVIWNSEDCLDERVPALQLRRLERFLSEHPGAPVLFSNFLGQLGLLLQEKRVNIPQSLGVWKSDLVRKSLARRNWASFMIASPARMHRASSSLMSCPRGFRTTRSLIASIPTPSRRSSSRTMTRPGFFRRIANILIFIGNLRPNGPI